MPADEPFHQESILKSSLFTARNLAVSIPLFMYIATLPVAGMAGPLDSPAAKPFGQAMPFGQAIDPSVLEQQRGGQETASQVFNDMKVNGNVTDNRALNNLTGHNAIT